MASADWGWVQFEGASVAFDSICIYAPKGIPQGAVFWVEYSSDGLNWQQAFSPVGGLSTSPNVVRFSEGVCSYIRLLVQGAPFPVVHFSAGLAIDFPVGLPEGWVRAVYDYSSYARHDRTGLALGAALTSPRINDVSLPMRYLPIAWLREVWLPFLDAVTGRFFPVVWNEAADEGMLCMNVSPVTPRSVTGMHGENNLKLMAVVR